MLSVPHAGRSQADGDAMQELLTKGVLPMLVFSSDDVDATFETVRASGAEVLQEPIDQGWGPRDCAFRDPSGNTVRISQAPRLTTTPAAAGGTWAWASGHSPVSEAVPSGPVSEGERRMEDDDAARDRGRHSHDASCPGLREARLGWLDHG